MGLFLEGEDGTWNPARGSIIQILFITGERKEMEIFRRNHPLSPIFLKKGTELSALCDLGWASVQIKRPQVTLEEGCSQSPPRENAAPPGGRAIAVLSAQMTSPRKGLLSHFQI